MADSVPRLLLSSGNYMPAIGLGTFQGNYDYSSVHDAVVNSVKQAIELGYRHFDTAAVYSTEVPLGQAVRECIEKGVVKREDVFITTKLWNTCHRESDVVPALQKSLKNLGLEYVDMFLVHWPMAFPPSEENIPKDKNGKILYDDDNTDITDTWTGMEKCQRQGLTRSIGISNFTVKQVQRILNKCTISPANIQIESNPFFNNEKLIQFCRDHNIVVSCFSPLSKALRPWAKEGEPNIRTDSTLAAIGKKYGKTSAQVALRFQVQRGLAAVPKSNSRDRQLENITVFDFELSEDDMTQIFKCETGFRVLKLEHFAESKEYPFHDDA